MILNFICRPPAHPNWRISHSRHLLRALALTALLAALCIPRVLDAKTLRIPFQCTKTLDAMLITVQINGKIAVLVFDTASNLTILSPEITGSDNHPAEFQISFPESSTKEDAHWGRVKIQLHKTIWKDHRVVVKNQDALCRLFGQKIDGILGKDILNEFASVTIDFKAHCILFKT